ncbi:Thylakoid lumenal 16.5 kDa protein-chloroplastic [Striga hermonthica]|uniref:Thylakoid lumenal 16.5 kDa protein-chloroplastic n=1 Tax=Striga hermonthica TaxID=68872 RepID=A0A9N7R1W0_STRHE|nr:Thylakoid lumenal 16.5 kDa protein-chloroplastic [Striga hermonthica]
MAATAVWMNSLTATRNCAVFCSLPNRPSLSSAPFKLLKGDEAAATANNVVISRRSISLNITATTTLLLSNLVDAYKLGGCYTANAAILEADDDEELLEKVKKDRKKRLEKQGVISSSTTETAYLQDLVYKLSETGQALEKNDLSAAYSVLGSNKDTEWVQRANSALNKLSSSNEEKTEVDAFNSSLVSLISSVSGNDIKGSKVAFVSCASALEKWIVLSGLVEQLKGL